MIWRFVANLVLPRSWPRRVWREPPILPAFADLMLRRHLLPGIADAVHARNPLLDRLNRGVAT